MGPRERRGGVGVCLLVSGCLVNAGGRIVTAGFWVRLMLYGWQIGKLSKSGPVRVCSMLK